jgi:CRISPR-associated protein Csa1
MYFLNDIEKKYLMNHLLKISRKVGVSEELRGWSWYKEPLKPYHDTTLPMYSVCSRYCETGRDIYLRHVEKEIGEPTPEMEKGSAIHEAVSSFFYALMEGKDLPPLEECDLYTKAVAEYVETEAKAVIMERKTEQPYATKRDILHTSLPFLIEHKISGKLLGLSDILSIDAFDYLRGIIFDLKTGKKRDFYRLYCTGYAIVFESVYEVPVDIGCTVYTDFRNGSLHILKDLFYISDDIRSWWVEERDTKLELVSTSNDPGTPPKCPETCMYYNICR